MEESLQAFWRLDQFKPLVKVLSKIQNWKMIYVLLLHIGSEEWSWIDVLVSLQGNNYTEIWQRPVVLHILFST